MSVSGPLQAGLGGIHRQFENLDRAAAEVLAASTEPSSPERVRISDAARDRATGNSTGAGVESGLIDLRISKYLAVASMKVIETGDETSRELAEIVRSKQP